MSDLTRAMEKIMRDLKWLSPSDKPMANIILTRREAEAVLAAFHRRAREEKMQYVKLKARSAKEARREISNRWPHLDVQYKGLDKNGETVLMSLVRKQGDKAHVATAYRNVRLPAVKFVAEVPEKGVDYV